MKRIYLASIISFLAGCGIGNDPQSIGTTVGSESCALLKAADGKVFAIDQEKWEAVGAPYMETVESFDDEQKAVYREAFAEACPELAELMEWSEKLRN